MTAWPDEQEQWQVVVVGGGPAGATVGRVLARWGVRVLLVAAAHAPKAGEVIGPQARAILAALGLSALFSRSPDVAQPCPAVVASWPESGIEEDDHSLQSQHGWTLDRPRLDALLRTLALESGCRWMDGIVVACEAAKSHGYVLVVKDSTRLLKVKAMMVVDATGRPASLVRRLGARRIVDDRLIAATVHVDPACAPDDFRLYLHAGPNGWWYRSNGPAGGTRIAVVADPKLPSGKPKAIAAHLLRIVDGLALNERNRGHFPSVTLLDASCTRLDCSVGDNWLAVGDAAAAFDPLCGQGLAQAFGSALAAAHAVRERLSGTNEAFAAYDFAIQATYRHSRSQLGLRYAYRAERERTDFWRARTFF